MTPLVQFSRPFRSLYEDKSNSNSVRVYVKADLLCYTKVEQSRALSWYEGMLPCKLTSIGNCSVNSLEGSRSEYCANSFVLEVSWLTRPKKDLKSVRLLGNGYQIARNSYATTHWLLYQP